MKRILFNISTLLLMTTLMWSCDGTKHLAAGEDLYLGPRIGGVRIMKDTTIERNYKIHERQTKNITVWMTGWPTPNGAFMGVPHLRFIPLRLFMYNAFYTEEESGFDHWMMENFGAPPKSVQRMDPALRLEKMKADLFALGHFDVYGTYEIYPRKKKNKARIGYHIYLPPAYTLDQIDYQLPNGTKDLERLFREHLSNNFLRSGDDFNLYNVNDDKRLLLERLQDNGYLYLTLNDIEVLADTTGGGRTVDLRLGLRPDVQRHKLEPTSVQRFDVAIDTNKAYQTVVFDDWSLRADTNQFNPRLIERCVSIAPESKYRYQERRNTITNLSSLGIFRSINVDYVPDAADSSKANAILRLREANRFELGAEGTVTSKSNSFFGPSVGLRLKQKNLFGGAQNITYGIDAFLDFPIGALSEFSSNSYGFSLNAEYDFPIISTPFGIGKREIGGLPKGILGLTAEYNDRAEYFRVINWRSDFGIKWKSSKYVSHRLNWISINYNNLLETTPLFDSLIDANQQIRESFEEQFFIGPGYSYFYNNTSNRYTQHRFFFRFDSELSGNAVKLFQTAVGQGEGQGTLLGLPYSQYLRLRVDGRYYLHLTDHQMIATRLSVGAGFAIGNSNYMPYIKQYYVGGMNSLRPFAPRIIGPGIYLPIEEELNSVNNITQSGDIIIEGNIEYRFPIVYKLKGALWSDFGNIYLRDPDPLRPGGEFTFDTFAERMVVTGGLGLRLDLDYFVIRWDFGWTLYYPWLEPGQRWIWNNDVNAIGGVIGIGYPF